MASKKVQTGTPYPRNRIGPSMVSVATSEVMLGDGVISTYSPPTSDVPLGTGGAATPLPPPPGNSVQPRVVYSGHAYSKQATVAISTYVDANNTREQFLQLALASWVGTTNFTVTKIRPTAATPVALLSFQVPFTTYLVQSFEFQGMNQSLLSLCQISVDLNGGIEWGPDYAILDGRNDLNIWAKTNDTINVNLIVPTGTDLVSTGRVVITGYRDI